MYVSSRGELGAVTYALNAPRNANDLGFIATAAAIIGAAATGASLFGGKLHQAPWGFLYDEYPRKIYEAEAVIRGATGEAMPPDPDPGNPKPKGGPAYQAAMLDIVPRYVPGSESQIAAYDRRLNEPGGAYEKTYQGQLDRLGVMQGRASTPMPAQQATAARPVSAGVAIPSTIPVTPRVRSPYDTTGTKFMQAGMIPDLGPYGPMILIGGAALVLILSMQSAPKGKGR